MSRRVRLSGLEASEIAAQWLTELPDASPRRRAQCLAWLKASPEHVREFLLMSAMWQGLEGVDPARRIDVEQLLAEACAKVVPLSPGDGKFLAAPRQAPVRRWIFAAAAAIAVLAVSSAWWVLPPHSGLVVYSTAVGEQRTVKLPDGSRVQMNTRSHIEVKFDKAARTVQLVRGEALFSVASDPRRPFSVRLRDTVIRALGTEFNVYCREGRDGGVTVSVVQGSVRVSSREEATLTAGEQVRVSMQGALDRLSSPDIDKATAWRERQLIFRGDPLETVAAEVNRYNESVQIRIEGRAARERRMIGVFAADDPESLVQFLEKEGDLEVERRGSQVLIRAR